MAVILCADDDVHTLYTIWKTLKADGMKVLTAGNGPAALEIARNYPGPIDLLITSLDLPRTSGTELAGAISAEHPETKALLMSRDYLVSGQASISGLPFLQKPFTASALRDSVAAVLGPEPSVG